ncbi:response regulator [Soonwooa purpurea]
MTTQFIIADDHPIFVKGITDIINEQQLGEVISCASTGRELLQKLNSCQANFIILDINMPELNGLEAAEKIKSLYPDIPILVVSMNEDYSTIEKLRQIGVNGFIPKSFENEDLQNAIRKILDKQSYFPEGYDGENFRKKQLSQREIEIIKLIIQGNSSREIAEQLNLSIFTVDTHRKNIGRKTGAKTPLQLSKLNLNAEA